jgi:hypothetical protein
VNDTTIAPDLKKFAVEFGKSQYLCFTPTLQAGVFRVTETSKVADVSDFIVLSDIPDEVGPGGRGRCTFMFSSPNSARYKQIRKNEPSYMYYMPTWSEEELTVAWPNIDKWIDRFHLFGGVPRHVFWSKKEYPERLLRSELQSKGSLMVKYFFECGFGAVDSDKSYMLVHVNPSWVTLENRYDYEQYEWRFASDENFKLLCEQHRNQIFSNAINIYNAGVASEAFGGGSAGNLFEKICLWLVPLKGKTLTICSLEARKSYSVILPQKVIILVIDQEPNSINQVPDEGYDDNHIFDYKIFSE